MPTDKPKPAPQKPEPDQTPPVRFIDWAAI